MGKLTSYTKTAIEQRQARTGGQWFSDLCERIADGEPLYQLAKKENLTYGALMAWIRADPDRNQAVTDAQQSQAQKYIDESIEIADTMTAEEAFQAKLRIDTRLRIAGKLDQRFGNGPNVAISGNNIQVVLTQFAHGTGRIEREVGDDDSWGGANEAVEDGEQSEVQRVHGEVHGEAAAGGSGGEENANADDA